MHKPVYFEMMGSPGGHLCEVCLESWRCTGLGTGRRAAPPPPPTGRSCEHLCDRVQPIKLSVAEDLKGFCQRVKAALEGGLLSTSLSAPSHSSPACPAHLSKTLTAPHPQGWGKIGLRRGGGGRGSLEPLSRTPPLLGSCDGALKKVMDGGK